MHESTEGLEIPDLVFLVLQTPAFNIPGFRDCAFQYSQIEAFSIHSNLFHNTFICTRRHEIGSIDLDAHTFHRIL